MPPGVVAPWPPSLCCLSICNATLPLCLFMSLFLPLVESSPRPFCHHQPPSLNLLFSPLYAPVATVSRSYPTTLLCRLHPSLSSLLVCAVFLTPKSSSHPVSPSHAFCHYFLRCHLRRALSFLSFISLFPPRSPLSPQQSSCLMLWFPQRGTPALQFFFPPYPCHPMSLVTYSATLLEPVTWGMPEFRILALPLIPWVTLTSSSHLCAISASSSVKCRVEHLCNRCAYQFRGLILVLLLSTMSPSPISTLISSPPNHSHGGITSLS